MKKTISRVLDSIARRIKVENPIQLEDLLVLQGRTLQHQHKADYNDFSLPISHFEFKVFSQWGDDGIIQYLINQINISSKTFVEFGVEDYTEANTKFLLINNNWRGLIIDGSESNINRVKNRDIVWRYDLTALSNFIDRENINPIISENGFNNNLGILHIDIDGNDYWVWESINCVDPDIVIVEYNSLFGFERAITIPYDPKFVRSKAHYSNLYYGASLLALCDLAQEKGYYFVGCNSAGNNAYFIKKNKIGHLKPLSCEEGYVQAKFKESRDKLGKLTFLSRSVAIGLIAGIEVFNTRTKKIEKF